MSRLRGQESVDQWYEILPKCLHDTSALPQPCFLFIIANLALAILTLYDNINDMKYFRNCLHHTSSVLQPFLLLIAANLAQAGFLGWKWSLWPVPTWLAVQRSIDVFFQTLYDNINDIQYFRTCLHHTSSVLQPIFFFIAANLALAGFLGWKWVHSVC